MIMKKILLGLVMLLTTATMSAQIELEHVFPGYRIDEIWWEKLLPKSSVGLDDMFCVNDTNGVFHFYDVDYNLHATIDANASIIAKNIFTTDGKICSLGYECVEFVGEFHPHCIKTRIYIINEDGKIIQEFHVNYGEFGYPGKIGLFKIANQYKLIIVAAYGEEGVYIYSCPGNGSNDSTSVQNVPAKVKRNAYPNPATDLVTLPYDANGATSMKIYDMQGKLVERKFLDKSKQELQLNVKDYPSGMYFFEVNGESNSFIVE